MKKIGAPIHFITFVSTMKHKILFTVITPESLEAVTTMAGVYPKEVSAIKGYFHKYIQGEKANLFVFCGESADLETQIAEIVTLAKKLSKIRGDRHMIWHIIREVNKKNELFLFLSPEKIKEFSDLNIELNIEYNEL